MSQETNPPAKPHLRVTARANGPLLVEGPVEVCDAQGQVLRQGERVALCRCGQSATKPFCDGAHGRTGFRAD